MSTIQKQAELRAAIKDSEKRGREREEVDTNVARLQKWMSDTKEITKPTEVAATILQSDIHKVRLHVLLSLLSFSEHNNTNIALRPSILS